MALCADPEQRLAAAVTTIAVIVFASAGAISTSILVIGVVATICAILAAISPVGALGAVAATLPWFHRPVEVGEHALAMSELLLACAAAGAASRLAWEVAFNRQRIGNLTRAIIEAVSTRLVLILGLLTMAGLWLSLSPYDPAHRSESLREWRWVLAEPLLMMALLGMFAACKASRQLIALALIAGLSVASAQALFDLAGGGVTVEGVTRVSGPFPHPNALALMATRVAALAFAWFVLERMSRRVLGMSAVMTALAVVATFSRGAWASMTVAMLLSANYLGGWARRVILSIPAAVITLAAIVASERVFSLFGGGSGSLRLSIWRSAIDMIASRPIRGYGPDQFLYAYLPRYVEPIAWQERFSSHAHNLILDFWIRLGIIGCAFAVSVVIVCLFSAAGIVRRSTGIEPLVVAARIALIALVVHGLVDDAYFSHELAMSGWLLGWLAFHPGRDSAVEGARSVASPRLRRRGFHWITFVRQPCQRRS